MIKNPAANAWDLGSIPGPGRSHMPQGNETHVPQLQSPHSATREALGGETHTPQLEKALTRQQRPTAAK